jgi:hypothetical protein
MIRPPVCLVAQGVVRDADTNNVSIFSIMEGILAQGFPFFIQHIVFLVMWDRDAEDIAHVPVRFAIMLDGEQLHEQSLDIDFQDKLKSRMTVNIQGLVVPKPGKLTFLASPSTGTSATYTIDVAAAANAVFQTSQSTG